jgi:hypothetical protein
MKTEFKTQTDVPKKKWRVVSPSCTDCASCKDAGSTVLIRCGQDKCPREYHVDCAFHQGGMTLNNDGVLDFFCDSHFKPMLFCSCKEEYNENKPMVFCDECHDWYHNSCEGLSAAAQLKDSYVCKVCNRQQKRPCPVFHSPIGFDTYIQCFFLYPRYARTRSGKERASRRL